MLYENAVNDIPQSLAFKHGFGADPFGYSALAQQRLGMAQTLAGFPVNISKPPTTADLKSPFCG